MELTYGAGADGFGPVSVAFVALLVVLVAAATWIARHPRLISALPDRARDVALVRRVWAWAQEHITARWSALARRFSVDGVAGVALFVGLAVVVALAAGFAEVLEDVLDGEGVAVIDQPSARWLAAHRDPWLTTTLRTITAAGSPAVLAALTALVAAAVAWRRRSWLPVLLGVVGAGGIGLIIMTAKAVVGRDRPLSPFAVITEDGFSFPSGHATGTAAVALLSAWMLSRWLITSWTGRVAVWTTAIGLAGAVGFSRIYLGVHYVSDILAGWLLGTAWAGAIILVGSWWDDSRRARTGPTGAVDGRG